MATPICIADSWRKPLTAIEIAKFQPEWDEVDKSNGLLPPDAPPTQALPDRTRCYVYQNAHQQKGTHHQQFTTVL